MTGWHVAGSYLEACNCVAICPCRDTGGRPGGRSTYGVCDFALFWQIEDGAFGQLRLDGLRVALAGSYHDEEHGSPWRVILYVDARGDQRRHDALVDIFLGRAGGTTFENFARMIGEVYAVRQTAIDLDFTPGRQRGRAADLVTLRIAAPYMVDETVSCGIPGHDHPGTELVADVLSVDDGPLRWELQGRCGFATDFAYTSSAV
jgi:hypothetical protein